MCDSLYSGCKRLVDLVFFYSISEDFSFLFLFWYGKFCVPFLLLHSALVYLMISTAGRQTNPIIIIVALFFVSLCIYI